MAGYYQSTRGRLQPQVLYLRTVSVSMTGRQEDDASLLESRHRGAAGTTRCAAASRCHKLEGDRFSLEEELLPVMISMRLERQPHVASRKQTGLHNIMVKYSHSIFLPYVFCVLRTS